MTKSGHYQGDHTHLTQNQKNRMSDDPGDGARNSDTLGADGSTPAEKKPEQDQQDQSTIEAFGEEGAGIAAKE